MNQIRKFIALLLCLCMVCSMLPMAAFAEEDEEPVITEEIEQIEESEETDEPEEDELGGNEPEQPPVEEENKEAEQEQEDDGSDVLVEVEQEEEKQEQPAADTVEEKKGEDVVLVENETALAPLDPTEGENPEEGTGHEEIEVVNPHYANALTVDDLDKPFNSGIAMLALGPEVDNYEDAGDIIREAMKDRQQTITFTFLSEELFNGEETFKLFLNQLFDCALAHDPSDPTAGDYLAWQYAGYGASVSYYPSGDSYAQELTLTVTYYTTAEQEEMVTSVLNSILNQNIGTDGDLYLSDLCDYDKVRNIYNYLCENVTYDYDNLNDDTYKLKHTAYAALIDRTAVCQGYAVLLYRAALELGVDCRVITSVDHAWNIVKLSGRYYDLDATWGAPSYSYDQGAEWFLRCEDNFPRHPREDQYLTSAFMSAYPMGQTDFVQPYLKGATLTLAGKIGVNFYLREFPACLDNGYIRFTVDTESGPSETTIAISELDSTENQNGWPVTQLIAARQMNDEITFEILDCNENPQSVMIHSSDGDYPALSLDYAASWYLDALSQKYGDSTPAGRLANNMQCYGGWAQKALNYRADDVDPWTPDSDILDETWYHYTKEGSIEGVRLVGMTLLLKSETDFRVFFDPGAVNVSCTIDGASVTPIQSDGRYYVAVPNIAAKDLDQFHTIQFTAGDERIDLSICGLTYLQLAKNNSNVNPNTLNMAVSLYEYHNAAKTYLASLHS